MNVVFKSIYRFIYFVFFLLIAYTFLKGLYTTIDMPIEGWQIITTGFYWPTFFTIIIIFVLVFHLKSINKNIILAFMLIPLTVTLIYGLMLPFNITNIDSAFISSHAASAQGLSFKELGDYLANNQYYQQSPYQTGLFLFNYLLIAVFGNNASEAFTVINIFAVYTIAISLFFICDTLFNSSKVLVFLTILEPLFLMPPLSVTYHYGWQIGLSFAALSLLLFIKAYQRNSILHYACSLLTLILSIFIKPNYIILGLAYICFALTELLISIKNKDVVSTNCDCFCLFFRKQIVN